MSSEPNAPWRESHTMIRSATNPLAAIQEAHRKLDELFEDWRRRRGAHTLTLISTQLLPVAVDRPATEERPAHTELIYWFTITYQVDGATPRVARGRGA